MNNVNFWRIRCRASRFIYTYICILCIHLFVCEITEFMAFAVTSSSRFFILFVFIPYKHWKFQNKGYINYVTGRRKNKYNILFIIISPVYLGISVCLNVDISAIQNARKTKLVIKHSEEPT